MDKVANLQADERRELFDATASQRHINPAIVEKDFWVCWVLKHLFSDPDLKDQIVFKGGTSLSKVFKLIERFSEDIDLVLDWQLLGYGSGEEDPFQDFASKSQQDHFNQGINHKAAEYIADTLVPKMERVFAKCPDVSVSVDEDEPQAVNIKYPAAFSLTYLRPEVRLEIGPLASWVPSGHFTIKSFSAESFPEHFDEPGCTVVATTAERTFWEKATILHQQAHRTNPMPVRYSRHYYDLSRLAESPIRESALAELRLLEDVVAFKQRFYPSRWASYETAKPGTFKILPSAERQAELRSDYGDMEEMIYGEVPTFDEIVEILGKLERKINQTRDSS